jgi:hypothetical protein
MRRKPPRTPPNTLPTPADTDPRADAVTTKGSWDWLAPWSIDLRSLALFRVGLGLLLLLDIAGRAVDLRVHYTDEGVTPRAHVQYYASLFPDDFGVRRLISPYMYAGDAWSVGALMALTGALAVLLMVGYQTRVVSIAAWFMLMAVQWRNPILLDGGDSLIRCLLFWAMFLPLESVASLDAARAGIAPKNWRLTSLGSAGLILQVAGMYFFGALFKNHPTWHTEYSAVYYTLNADSFATHFGQWLLNFPALLKFLTGATYWLEMLGPCVLLLPWRNNLLRCLLILAFWGFHFSLVLTMELGLFPWLGILAWVPMIPANVWDWLGRRFPSASVWYARVTARLARPAHTDQHLSWWRRLATPRAPMGRIGKVFCGLLIVYAIFWNLRETNPKWGFGRIMPSKLNFIGRFTGLDQRWDLFAPFPMTNDGWLVVHGFQRNNEVVNLWPLDNPSGTEKPPHVADVYLSQRWRKYLLNISGKYYGYFQPPFAEWLAREWKKRHPNNPDLEIKRIELVYIVETTPPPGEPWPEMSETIPWTGTIDENGKAKTLRFP